VRCGGDRRRTLAGLMTARGTTGHGRERFIADEQPTLARLLAQGDSSEIRRAIGARLSAGKVLDELESRSNSRCCPPQLCHAASRTTFHTVESLWDARGDRGALAWTFGLGRVSHGMIDRPVLFEGTDRRIMLLRRVRRDGRIGSCRRRGVAIYNQQHSAKDGNQRRARRGGGSWK